MKGNSSISEPPAQRRGGRLAAIDAARGVAVLAMIEWHAADAWIADPSRGSEAFHWMQRIGGIAAPAFVLLAGLAIALASPERPDARQTGAAIARALRIVLAGYALRLFSCAVDHGGVLDPRASVTMVAAALGLGLLWAATTDAPRPSALRLGLALAGSAAMQVAWWRSDGATSMLWRLDVLHGIGAALIATALALHATRSMRARARASVLAGAAAVIAAASGPMVGVPQTFLPAEIAAWIARPSEASSGFPLFPWLAYAMSGAAIAFAMRARALASQPSRTSDRWRLPGAERPALLVAVAVALAALAWEHAPIAALVLDRAEGVRGVFRLVANTAIIAACCGGIAMLAPRAPRAGDVLAVLGRCSLIVYCVHLELVYGLVGLPLQRALGVGGWALGVVAITLAMVMLARAIERASARARSRSSARVHAIA